MSKAEDRAYEVYPKMSRISEPHGVIPADNNSHYLGDGNKEKREGFIVGYNQAEKDLELTWEDIASINDVVTEMLRECGDYILYDTEEAFCKEVLKRFKEIKK